VPAIGRDKAPQVLAFDVYGTLLDTTGVAGSLPLRLDDRDTLARAWRRHQLEITWLLTAMGRYESLDVVTGYALDVALAETGRELSAAERAEALMGARTLAPYPEAAESLDRLAASGVRLVVLSNGTAETLDGMLRNAGIRDPFDDVISANEIGMFKPSPAVYQHGAARLGMRAHDVWLVSGNPFDCAGAKNAGLGVAKVERGPSFTYGFAEPADLVVGSLAELADVFAESASA
jgi:2-haloacid dehalogenase